MRCNQTVDIRFVVPYCSGLLCVFNYHIVTEQLHHCMNYVPQRSVPRATTCTRRSLSIKATAAARAGQLAQGRGEVLLPLTQLRTRSASWYVCIGDELSAYAAGTAGSRWRRCRNVRASIPDRRDRIAVKEAAGTAEPPHSEQPRVLPGCSPPSSPAGTAGV